MGSGIPSIKEAPILARSLDQCLIHRELVALYPEPVHYRSLCLYGDPVAGLVDHPANSG